MKRREEEAVREIDALAQERSASVVAEVTERVADRQTRLAAQVFEEGGGGGAAGRGAGGADSERSEGRSEGGGGGKR